MGAPPGLSPANGCEESVIGPLSLSINHHHTHLPSVPLSLASMRAHSSTLTNSGTDLTVRLPRFSTSLKCQTCRLAYLSCSLLARHLSPPRPLASLTVESTQPVALPPRQLGDCARCRLAGLTPCSLPRPGQLRFRLISLLLILSTQSPLWSLPFPITHH